MGGGGKGGGDAKPVEIGHRFHLGMHLAICHSVDEVKEILVGDRQVWAGTATGNNTIYINKPNLFGGNKKEGGIVGPVNMEFGRPTQGINYYLYSKMSTVLPAFRGILALVLNQCYVTAMTPYPKPWSVVVKRLPAKTWYSAKANIGGSANPAHIIYDTFTNSDWGMGYPAHQIDDASFKAAADTLYSENFGISLLLSKQGTVEQFIYNQILSVIQGTIILNKDNGKFQLKLIRDDYDKSTLLVFDESNIIKINQFQRPQPMELINEVIIRYRPRGKSQDETVSVQDLANIQAQGGVVSQTIEFPGIDTAAIASKVALRELKVTTSALAQVSIIVNRKGWNLRPGDVFKFSWEAYGIANMILRIVSIKDEGYLSQQLLIECVEDVFGLPDSSYFIPEGTGWVDPISEPLVARKQRLIEISYWDIFTKFDPLYTANVDEFSCFVAGVAEAPIQATQGFQFWSTVSSGNYQERESSPWSFTSTLVNDIIETDTTFLVKNYLIDIGIYMSGFYVYLNDEVLSIKSINEDTGVVVVGRGCLDTIAQKHSADSIMWWCENKAGVDSTPYAPNELIYGKMLTTTGSAVLPLNTAPASHLYMIGRQNKPYPPGRFRINNLAYPTSSFGSDELLTISWAHRDRTLQLNRPMQDADYGNIGPETGVTYTLLFYNENGTLVKTESGITGTSYIWTNEGIDSGQASDRLNQEFRVVLFSVRDGYESWQRHEYIGRRDEFPPTCEINPVITGNNTPIGETLTCNTGTWEFSPDSYEYQWQRDGSDITGETSNTYVTVVLDDGIDLVCNVTAINIHGQSVQSSNIIAMPDLIIVSNLTLPVMTGTYNLGQALSVSNGTWDGTTPITYDYQWLRDGVDISGATNNTYTLVASDLATSGEVTCRVTATNLLNSDNAETLPITFAPTNTALPVLSGVLNTGETITSTTGTWNGSPPLDIQYQWQANGSNIPGETTNTYTLIASDLTKVITCRLSVYNMSGFDRASTEPLDSIPINTVLPVISGNFQIGQTLSISDGTWIGTTPINYTYQWQADGSDIGSATNNTYLVLIGDLNKEITCEVTATNSIGNNSIATAGVRAEPENTVIPEITGTVAVGQILTSSTGTWAGYPTIAYTYQWQRNGSDISGETNNTYELIDLDVGQSITCEVTATNSIGNNMSEALTIVWGTAPENIEPPVISL